MSGGLITILLAAIVIVIAAASYRRRDGDAPQSQRPALILGALAVVAGAIILFLLYRRPGI